MAKKPYIRYASLAHDINRHNKITPTPGHQWLPFKGQYFFPSLATCWSKLMLPLMDYQVVLLGLNYWYLPTCRTLKSPLKRNLPSITFPICHNAKQFVTGTGAVEAALVWYFLLILQHSQPFLQWYCAEEPSIPCLEIRVCQCLLLFLGSTVSKHPPLRNGFWNS